MTTLELVEAPLTTDAEAWEARALEAEAACRALGEQLDACRREAQLLAMALTNAESQAARARALLRQAARSAELGDVLGPELLSLVLAEVGS